MKIHQILKSIAIFFLGFSCIAFSYHLKQINENLSELGETIGRMKFDALSQTDVMFIIGRREQCLKAGGNYYYPSMDRCEYSSYNRENKTSVQKWIDLGAL